MEADRRGGANASVLAVLLTVMVAGCLGDPDGAADESDDSATLPVCSIEARPAPRGYAVAAAGPDGQVRIHTGFDGQFDVHFLVDQSIYYDRWVFDAQEGCWLEEGDSPLLNWAIVYAASSDTYVGYDWHGAEETPYLVNAATPLSEIWTRTSDGIWKVDRPADLAARNGPAMAYDPESDRVVLFGGCAVLLAVCLDDTWAYDVDSGEWTRMDPSMAPSWRSYHAMEYDPRLGAVVLFGGLLEPTTGLVSDETWMYNLRANQWTRFETDRTPPARDYPQLAYVPELDRLYLFGGSAPSQRFGDLWYLDVENRTWVEVATSGGPSPRAWHAMAYSSDARALVVYGGGDVGGGFRDYTDETWLFYPQEERWHSPDRR